MNRLALAITSLLGLVSAAACSKGNDPPICAEGVTRCENNRYQECGDDGRDWVVLDDCVAQDQLCTTNMGCVDCFPDTRACDGQDIVRCRPDGSGTDVLATCNGAIQELCSGGECVDACALAAASRDYEGCDYWPVDLDNAVVNNQGAASAQQFSVVVSNASPLDADVRVEIMCTAADAANPATPCTVSQ
jgi:hypothetical protein